MEIQTLRTDLWIQLSGEEGDGGMYGESNMEINNTIYKIDSQWEFAEWLRELKPRFCNNLEGWDGKGGRREVQVGVNLWQIHANTKL